MIVKTLSPANTMRGSLRRGDAIKTAMGRSSSEGKAPSGALLNETPVSLLAGVFCAFFPVAILIIQQKRRRKTVGRLVLKLAVIETFIVHLTSGMSITSTDPTMTLSMRRRPSWSAPQSRI